MTAKELFEAVGLVDDDLVLAADAPLSRRRAAAYWRFVPLAACLCLAVGIWHSDGRLLDGLMGLVLPPTGAAAPAESAESSAEASSETFSGQAENSVAAAGESPEEGTEDQAAAYDPASAKEDAEASRVTAQGDGGVPGADTCPVDGSGYGAWCTVDTSQPAEDGWALPAGTLCLFTQDGGPFVPDGSGIWTLTLQIEAAEGTWVEAGYAPAGGSPVACYEGAAGEFRVTLGEDAACYFYLVIQGEGSAVVNAVPAQAVRCPVTPAE